MIKRRINDLIKLRLTKKIYLSFGENCLTDNILNRYNLKSFTTPFSHGRSNVEYILSLEEEQYKNFLDTRYINYEELNGKNVPRLTLHRHLNNSYHSWHMKGFEFTHHDVIKSEKVRIKFQDRVDRLIKYKGKKKYIIMYHHRTNEHTDRNKLIDDLLKLRVLYSKNGKDAIVVLFYQEIVDHVDKRSLELSVEPNIHTFKFKTLDIWAGEDANILWGKCDEDLISKMITLVKSI